MRQLVSVLARRCDHHMVCFQREADIYPLLSKVLLELGQERYAVPAYFDLSTPVAYLCRVDNFRFPVATRVVRVPVWDGASAAGVGATPATAGRSVIVTTFPATAPRMACAAVSLVWLMADRCGCCLCSQGCRYTC